MSTTSIEWTDATWNPVTGCDRVSEGCTNCYALTLAKRLKAMGNPRYQKDGKPPTSGPGFGVTLHPDKLADPINWAKPRRVFVNSMSDLFHAEVPVEFIARVFAVMALAPQHTFQVLTKRPQRMKRILNDPSFWGMVASIACQHRDFEGKGYNLPGVIVGPNRPLPNVWLGTSIENQEAAYRIDWLVRTPAAVRFLSCEPLLGLIDLGHWLPVELDETTPWIGVQCDETACERPARYQRTGRTYSSLIHECEEHVQPRIDWVIVGGESGPGYRPMRPGWAYAVRDQCAYAGVPFFFKQHGGLRPKAGGRLLDGREWSEFPVVAGVTA